MKVAGAAPLDLVELRTYILRAKKADERLDIRLGLSNHSALQKEAKLALARGEMHDCMSYPDTQWMIQVLDALLDDQDSGMQSIWASLAALAQSFKPGPDLVPMYYLQPEHFTYGVSQSIDLYRACVIANNIWINTSRQTGAESSELLGRIAKCAGKLRTLLLQIDGSVRVELLDIVNRLEQDELVAIGQILRPSSAASEAEEPDEQDGTDRTVLIIEDDELEEELTDEDRSNIMRDVYESLSVIPPLPQLLNRLQSCSLERAKNLKSLAQPNHPEAEGIHLVRYLSEYFKRTYGRPLNATVATLARSIMKMDVDEARVKQLVRLG